MRSVLLLLAVGITSFAAAARAQQSDDQTQLPGVPWPATDALGRSTPTGAELAGTRANRTVCMFYFLWHGAHEVRRADRDGPFDISQILAADGDARAKPDSPLWGPFGAPHYWGQPLYGYYRSDDPWVLRRHAYLLADAGVDALVFDTTNAVIYRDTFLELCRVFHELRQEGERTPQIAFMVNTAAGATADKIFHELYEPGLFRELWFQWQGKPLLICDPAAASDTVKNFFTLRRAHWPFEMVNTDRAWHWEATFPQPFGYVDNQANVEQLTVSVAQNLRASDGRVTNMSRLDARGRSFHDGDQAIENDSVGRGANFQEQWDRALQLDPPVVLVTGWNEWIAGRFGEKGGPITFVDQYDEEFSRDIEPMRGGHGDNYYYQLVANVRRYKGISPTPRRVPGEAFDSSQGWNAWAKVTPEFIDHVGETIPRDHAGVCGLHYAETSGRNDFVVAKVARDADRVYFYLRARKPWQGVGPPSGTWLLIDVDQRSNTGWHGYDLIVNRQQADGQALIERSVEDDQWRADGRAELRVEGEHLQLALPRALLPDNKGALKFDFKWVDHLPEPIDIADFYTSGDVAPEGRFNYRYQSE